jgi:phosphoribosyl-ATP pyrophosphohydrolase
MSDATDDDEAGDDVLRELFAVIEDRKETLPADSYTASLLDHEKGENAALEKLGEEATEFLLAAKDGDADELAHEGADVVYHMLVVLAQQNVDVDALLDELEDRR